MRTQWLFFSGVACVLALACSAPSAGPLFIYNRSPSAPVGMFVRVDTPLHIGAFVTVRARDVAPDYARLRDFSGDNNRFLKRVVAIAGARVCARGDRVTVGAALILDRHTQDSFERALPRWQGCRVLSQEEVFLLGDTEDSFDARYWGPTNRALIDGVWRPLRPIELPVLGSN